MDIEFFRKRLNSLRDEILEVSNTGEQAAQTVELDQGKVGRLSRMDAMQAQAMSLETKRRRELYLQQIETALSRLDKDDYGRCIDCDEIIAYRRLEFDPAALRCIDCAGKIES
jgi:DnaK suppressor protein